RWGYATSGRNWMLTRRATPPRGRAPVHQADYYRLLVRGLDVACGDEPPRIGPTVAARERASALLAEARVPPGAPIIGLAPGAAYGSAKQWPTDRVAAVAAQM